MLHEIVADNLAPRAFQLSNSGFRTLIEKLNNKKTVIPIAKFYDFFNENKFNGEYVITFDDVHESVYKYAFPLLVYYNIPFTLFVHLSLLDTPNYITFAQLHDMNKNSLCTIGSHGINHIFYRNLSSMECAFELRFSKESLEKILRKPIDYFAFPYGSLVAVSFRNINDVKNLGFKMSFLTIPSGIWHSPLINKYFVPRINVTQRFIEKL